MIAEEWRGEKERMKLSELGCAGGLRAILNLDSRINEGKQSPEEMWLEALTYPPSPPPPPPRQKGQSPEKISPARVSEKPTCINLRGKKLRVKSIPRALRQRENLLEAFTA